MTPSPWFLIAAIVAMAVIGLAACAWFSVFNSEAGERYRKMRMQGPFVPIDDEDPVKPR